MFIFHHNHNMLEPIYSALLPAYIKMTTTNIIQIENFRKVGIRPPHMFSDFTNNFGGYEKVGFVNKDIYNQIERQRCQYPLDVKGAFTFFREMYKKDALMFITYIVDEQNIYKKLSSISLFFLSFYRIPK